MDFLGMGLTSLLLAVIAFATTVWTAVFTTIIRRRRASTLAKQEVPAPLETKLELVSTLSGQLSRLNEEIQNEFRVQLAETERLKAEAEDSSRIAALNMEAVEATKSLVRSQLSSELEKSTRADRRFQVVLTAASFLAGSLTSLLLSGLANGA